MELIATRLEEAPRPGRIRLVGVISYDDAPDRPEEWWYEVPEGLAESLSRTGDPWLAGMLPLAAWLGEDIRLAVPVDRLLMRNARELLCIWKAWYPELSIVELEAEEIEAGGDPGRRVASFFSGGVDSFYTLLRNAEPDGLEIDEVVTVGGFDIRLDHLEAFRRRTARWTDVVRRLGKSLVEVTTNLRDTRLESAGWGRLWHGPGVASVGLALEGRYRRALIASTFDYANLVPLGSHPMTDPLFSTTATEVIHDGASKDRFSKSEYLSRHEIALQNLHVCFRTGSDSNCGDCEKCYRTMTLLELLGCLSRATTFPATAWNVERLSEVFLHKKTLEKYYRRIQDEAKERGRMDILRAVDRSIQRSRRIRALLTVPNWMAGRRGLWRAAGPIRRTLLAGAPL